MDKENNKKRYRKMDRKYRKQLKRIVKDCGPWEYGYIFYFIETYLK